MAKVLMICHGNICRSPMAEMIFRALLNERGLTDWVVASAATSREEIGSDVDYRARRTLERHGVECLSREARQVTSADYECFDWLIGMSQVNCTNMLRILGSDSKGKVRRLLPDGDVADPWYTGDFETAYRDIERGCRGLLEALLQQA